MKRIIIRLSFAAAVAAVAAGVASAQSMKADIPFSFRLGGQIYAAGSYSFGVEGVSPRLQIRNSDTRRGGMQLASYIGDPAKEWRESGKPVLAFECGLGHCQLVQMWPGMEKPALNFPRPRMGRDEVA